MLLKTFFLIFLIFVGTFVRSQPNQFAEFQRSISNAKGNAAYIEAIESAARTPNAKWQPSGVDRQAINQMTTAWKNDPNGGVITRQWSTSDMAVIKAQEAISDQAAKAEKMRAEGLAAVTVPIYRDLITTGISSLDASRIIDLGINKDGTVSKQFPYLYLMTYPYKAFREQAQKASFTDLLSLVLQYETLVESAISSLDVLEKRFPEQRFIIDMTRLKVLPFYFSSLFLEGNFSSAYVSQAAKADQDRMSNLFFSLADSYPETSRNFLRLCDNHYNPYVTKIKLLQADKKTHKEAKVLALKYLNMPNDNFMAAMGSTRGYWYLHDLGVPGLEKLAKMQNVHPMDMIFGERIEGNDYRTWQQYWPSGMGKYYDYLKHSDQVRKLIKEFADAGYPDAQNLYAIRLGLGFEKGERKDALVWLQKAVAGGNKIAVQNLKEICQRDIKGIEEYCKSQK